MARLGFDKNETSILVENKLELIKKSKIFLVMSHLSCADDIKSKMNKKQLEEFNTIRSHFPNCMHSL